jgi:hypothetical protein
MIITFVFELWGLDGNFGRYEWGTVETIQEETRSLTINYTNVYGEQERFTGVVDKCCKERKEDSYIAGNVQLKDITYGKHIKIYYCRRNALDHDVEKGRGKQYNKISEIEFLE